MRFILFIAKLLVSVNRANSLKIWCFFADFRWIHRIFAGYNEKTVDRLENECSAEKWFGPVLLH